MPPCTLQKDERLHGRTAIASLLHGGRYGTVSFVKYCVAEGNGLPYNRILVSVPKRHFKRAVKRNLLKRRLRESYRLQKALLPSGGKDLMFLYNSPEIKPFADICAAVGAILNKLARDE